jgi:hypothetical protein
MMCRIVPTIHDVFTLCDVTPITENRMCLISNIILNPTLKEIVYNTLPIIQHYIRFGKKQWHTCLAFIWKVLEQSSIMIIRIHSFVPRGEQKKTEFACLESRPGSEDKEEVNEWGINVMSYSMINAYACTAASLTIISVFRYRSFMAVVNRTYVRRKGFKMWSCDRIKINVGYK